MARTERYTAEQVAQALTKSMGLVSVAAQSLGCSQTTIRTYIERYESVKQAQLDSREQMVDLGEAALVKAVKKGEGWAVALLLKTLGKHRGYVESVKVDDWRSQAIEDIKAGRIQYKALAQTFDKSLADELFQQAGVPIAR